MATSFGSNTSLSLQNYILTSATCQEQLNKPLSFTNFQSGNIPAQQYIQRFSDDPLFSDITATVVTPKFAKRCQLTRIDVCSSESFHSGDKYSDCFTVSLLDRYLTRGLPNSCQTSRGRFVRKQVSPVCNMDIKDIKSLRCNQLCAENVLSVWVENRDKYLNKYSSNSSEDEKGDQFTFCTSRNEKRESILVHPPRGKSMIIKSAEKGSHGEKIKKNYDKSNISEIGPYLYDMVEWSRTIASLDAKAQHRIQNKPSKDGSHRSNDVTWSSRCSNYDGCSIKGHTTGTNMPTRHAKNVNVCERFQKERSSCYDTNSTQNSNSLHIYESGKYVRKRLTSTEFKRKVHMNYGDGKRRRMKTNGILKPASSNVTIINDILTSADVSRQKLTNLSNKSHVVFTPVTRAISRSVGPCKKQITMKINIILMKKNCSRILYL
ncbi:hypothetical protein ACJMK2_034552 [Sinanodonta woodiana]|uniref:Uncharacterized protein n=1 Tax=Sinanodonta woodiana TaxID=1069815 RepID=A0ABD3WRZ5_SINWO